ncbi:hypothetical protein PIB30_055794 [Stylosanthes scabra]|uniref:Transmembrane protein n=1 Tax=Stylosanthes scabra TaxID=79078 RepID=A0ABU6QIT3_9FABA|nr:hypothetical protein [Stylosanthes scabra]
MELQDSALNRVSIGFPLGLGFLFACLIFVCGFFCCCLHWKKFQAMFLSSSSSAINSHHHAYTQQQADSTYYQYKLEFPVPMVKQNYAESLPVLMPGDEIPKFIAMACPCQPPREEKITIHVQKEEAQSNFCSSN